MDNYKVAAKQTGLGEVEAADADEREAIAQGRCVVQTAPVEADGGAADSFDLPVAIQAVQARRSLTLKLLG